MTTPSTLDVRCKKTLEVLLRPKYFRIIHPWLAISTDSDKQILAHVGDVLQGSFAKSGARSQPNAYNLPRAIETVVQGSLDIEQLREGKPSGPRCKSISSRAVTRGTYKSSEDVHRAFAMENRPLRSLPFSQIFTSKALERVEEWQTTFEDSTQWPNKSALERVLRSLWVFNSSMPTYTGLIRDDPTYQRPASAPFRLHELSMVNRDMQSSIAYEANRRALLYTPRALLNLSATETDPYSTERFKRTKVSVAPHNKGRSVLPKGGSRTLTTTYLSTYVPRVNAKWHKDTLSY